MYVFKKRRRTLSLLIFSSLPGFGRSDLRDTCTKSFSRKARTLLKTDPTPPVERREDSLFSELAAMIGPQTVT